MPISQCQCPANKTIHTIIKERVTLMKKLSMLVAAGFAFVSFGAIAVPKAAEHSGGAVVSASASAPAPKAAAEKKPAKKQTKKSSTKKKA